MFEIEYRIPGTVVAPTHRVGALNNGCVFTGEVVGIGRGLFLKLFEGAVFLDRHPSQGGPKYFASDDHKVTNFVERHARLVVTPR